MKIFPFSFFLLLGSCLFYQCEHPIPKDVMFCKVEEVFVLETPFEAESAIIVMYKGDDLKLLGDTVYMEVPDTVEMDSSIFYVKVKAKRGVVGWVNIQDIQKERPQIAQKKPKRPKIVKKKIIPPKDTTPPAPDSIAMTDSLYLSLLGTYQLLADSTNFQLQLDSLDSLQFKFNLAFKSGSDCNGNINGIVLWNGRSLNYFQDSCQLFFLLNADTLTIQEIGNCLNSNIACPLPNRLFRSGKTQLQTARNPETNSE